MTKIGKLYIAIISILIIVFIVLMFLSTDKSGLEITYNIKDTFVINNTQELNNVKIGEVIINNNGFLPKRIKLDNYVICPKSTNAINTFYEYTNYRGGRVINVKNTPIIYNDYYDKNIDISSGDMIKLYIYMNTDYNLFSSIKMNKLYNATLTFYLFNTGEDLSYYNYCDILNAENAEKIITIQFNLNPKDFSDIK